MNEQEALNLARHRLITERAKAVEAGQHKTCQSPEGEGPPAINLRPPSECPSCGQEMSYLPGRRAYICLRDTCQKQYVHV